LAIIGNGASCRELMGKLMGALVWRRRMIEILRAVHLEVYQERQPESQLQWLVLELTF